MHGGNLVWIMKRGLRTALVSPGGHCVFASLARTIGTFDLELAKSTKDALLRQRRVQRNVGAKGLLFVVSLHKDETRWADSEHQWGLIQRLSVKTWI
jgi:hypothetical protein